MLIQHLNQDRIVVEVSDLASSKKKSVIHVLHVDDDPSLLEITKLILLDLDSRFEIDCACCVDEALKKLSTGHYDVVVSDYEMPQKDGIQFLKELREQKNEIPFILFTGKGREEVAIKALNLGANAYHNKQGSPETVYGELAYSILQNAERKETEQALVYEQNFARVLLENMEAGVVACNAEGKLTLFNRTAHQWHGLNPLNIPQKDWANYYGLYLEDGVTPMDESTVPLVRALQGEAIHKAGMVIAAKDKPKRHIVANCSVVRSQDGKLVGAVGVMLDVTEAKKAESELRQKYEMLERVGESVGAGLAIIGKDYRVTWANSTLRSLGVDGDKKCYQIFNKLETPCPDCGVKKIFEQNASFDAHEYKTVNSKGETVWIELRVTPIKDKGGNVTAALELAVPITERKNIEQSLRDSEEKFRGLSEKSPNMIFIYDRGRVVYVNKKSEEIMGYCKDEFYSSDFNFLSLISPEYFETLKSAFSRHMKGEEVPQYEFVLITRVGKRINAIINSSLIEYNGNKAMLGIVTDITDRKQAEETLKESEQRYRELANCLPDIVFETDLNGRLEFVNERATEISGYSLNEIKKGLNILQFLVSEDREKATKNIQRLLTGGSYAPAEYTFLRKDGTTFSALITTTPRMHNNKVTGLRGIVLDISSRKKSEEIIRKSEVRYRELANSLPEIVFEADLTGKITFFNRRAFEITGFTSEDFEKGMNMLSFVVPEDRERAMQNTVKTLDREEHSDSEYRLFRKNGSIYPAIVRTAPIS